MTKLTVSPTSGKPPNVKKLRSEPGGLLLRNHSEDSILDGATAYKGLMESVAGIDNAMCEVGEMESMRVIGRVIDHFLFAALEGGGKPGRRASAEFRTGFCLALAKLFALSHDCSDCGTEWDPLKDRVFFGTTFSEASHV
ncbi:MAG: hypothetical protein V4569_04510 [Pseudomonadota bacterium]